MTLPYSVYFRVDLPGSTRWVPRQAPCCQTFPKHASSFYPKTCHKTRSVFPQTMPEDKVSVQSNHATRQRQCSLKPCHKSSSVFPQTMPQDKVSVSSDHATRQGQCSLKSCHKIRSVFPQTMPQDMVSVPSNHATKQIEYSLKSYHGTRLVPYDHATS